jgi:hypothetical protein
VLEYAHHLAQAGQSDIISVPAMSDEGAHGKTILLIGPTSEIFAAPALDRGVDLDDAEAVAYMREKTRHLLPPKAVEDHFEHESADFDN